MYLIIGIYLLIVAILEFFSKKRRTVLFYISITLLCIILCIRYGQGTDYFGYQYLYSNIKDIGSELVSSSHGEILWRLTQSIFKSIGLSFQHFVFFISLIMSFCIAKGIKQFSPYKNLSLLIMYPTIFLVYQLSAFREGLIISIFLGVGLKMALEKKTVKYYLITLLLCLIHTSAVILLTVPIIINYKKALNKKTLLLALICAIVFIFSGVWKLLYSNIIEGASTNDKISFSFLAVLERIVLYTLTYVLYKKLQKNKLDYTVKTLFNIYRVGFVIFIILCFNSLVSQRLTAPLKAIEIFLIPILFWKCIKTRRISTKNILLVFFMVLAIATVEIFKNTNTIITQGHYKEGTTIYNTKIYTIFNKEEAENSISNRYLEILRRQ